GFASATPAQRITLAPRVIANLTAQPAAAVSPDLAEAMTRLQPLLDGCPAYSPERRRQMQQHIDWITQPAGIPTDILIALGDDPPARLLFGMASYTAIEWRLQGRPADSCLLPIGRLVNALAVAAGEEALPEFE
ncbi:MAG: hypothetical protein MUE40_12665, partial [Anaerolineae bacterium]|nr:hypothetical protein [Anaerolineae bacterium]